MENQFVQITRNNEIIAEHRTDHPNSRYGSPVWTINVQEPEPGPAMLTQGETIVPIKIIGVQAGWLVVRDEAGMLAGIIWSDGSYYADSIVDENGFSVPEISSGCQVRGTLPIGELGAILF